MVQTGFKAEAHCWKCFKENTDMSLIDGKPINLCKGCIYVLKVMSQWLNAYGLAVRVVGEFTEQEETDQDPGGKDRVGRGRRGPARPVEPSEHPTAEDIAAAEHRGAL